ncbi:MAG: hypothetical protein WC401_08605 [Bacteroidales bacterium]|jgi:hypothetical protein
MNSSKENEMLRSICDELGIPNLVEILAETPLRRLQPILINAWKRRSAERKATDVLDEYDSKKQFYGVGSIPQNQLMDFAQICYSAVPSNFDFVEMSPIAPFAVNAVLSNISQNKTLSTIRGSEVVGDATTQLSLECASRRKKLFAGVASVMKDVHLCSSQRVVRLQPFDSSKGYMQHFNLFGLCSGGRNSASRAFAIEWIKEHISILLDMLMALGRKKYLFYDISVRISDLRFIEQIASFLKIPRDSMIRQSADEDFNFFREFKVDFPEEVETMSSISAENFVRCGLVDQTAYFSHLEEGIISPIRKKYQNVRFCFDFSRKDGLGYYPHICFHIFAKTRDGRCLQLADGGAVDWLAKLLNNKKEAMVTSGIGSELIQKFFNPEA